MHVDARLLRPKSLSAAVAGALISFSAISAESANQAPTVEVVGTSPVPGLDRPKDEIPSNVQSIPRASLRDTGSGGLPELLGSQLQSVNVNEIQGNP